MKNRFLSMALVLCMLLSLLPLTSVTAIATMTVTAGAFTVTGGAPDTDYTFDNGVLTVTTETALTIQNTDPATATNHRIAVKKNVSANITLAGVNIDLSGENDNCAFEIASGSKGNVTITLADGTTNTLKSGGNRAGLEKEGTLGSLTIQCAHSGEADHTCGDSCGKLTASSTRGAGIGSGFGNNSDSGDVSNITVNGGTVTAKSTAGAGIGSGQSFEAASGNVLNITVNGGYVDASSTNGGGIGSGEAGSTSGNASSITVNGGYVDASSTNGGGIGSGNSGGTSGSVSNITVNVGYVTASSTIGGGIGSGEAAAASGNVSSITVKNGSITASSTRGAGIGCGDADDMRGSVSNITISGGSVKANGRTAIGNGVTTVTPTDGSGNDVYLYTIENPDGKTVTVNGVDYPKVHTYYDGFVWKSETKVYPYVPHGPLTITLGDTTTEMIYNSETEQFEKLTYTVTYAPGANGTGTVAAGTKIYGENLMLSSNTFNRTGYTQIGWATADGGDKVYDLNGSYTANAAITLYPVWKINQYTITVKPENGDNDITITQNYGTTVTAPSVTRDGYAFDGWDKAFPTTMPAESVTITAKWKDITAPTGEIKLGANTWRSFLNNITFGLFFKDTQEVTINATDNSGEEVTVEYLLSDKELFETDLATATFTAYTDKFNIESNNEYVIYAKLTDKTGNVTYLSSDGIVLDNIAPVISGIEDGKTYCAARTVTVSDKYEITVTVNGNPVTPDTNGQFTLSPTEGEQKVVVTDKAGNKTEMTVTVNDGHTGGTATCTDKAACDVCGTPYGELDAANHADEKEWSTQNATQHEETWKCCGAVVVALEDHEWKDGVCEECGYVCLHTGGTADCTHKAKCDICGEEYGEVDNGNHNLEHIKESAATVTETGNTEYWHCKDCDNNFSDKDGKNVIDLKDTVIGKLPPEIIDGKGQSLAEGETRELTFRSNAAFGDFIRVEVDGKTVDKANYTAKEGSTVVTLKADYVATLSAGEHTLGIVSESGTAETTFTVNAKKVDTNSPQTGDISYLTLWFALLFVSGCTLAGTALYGKKKSFFG